MWIREVTHITVSGDIVLAPTEGRARNQGGRRRADGDTGRRWDRDAADQPGN